MKNVLRIAFVALLTTFIWFSLADVAYAQRNSPKQKKSLVTNSMANKVAYWASTPNGGIMTYFYDANNIKSVMEGDSITQNILQHKDYVERFIVRMISAYGVQDGWLIFKDLGFTTAEYDIAKRIYKESPKLVMETEKDDSAKSEKSNENTGQEYSKPEDVNPEVQATPSFDVAKYFNKNQKYPAVAQANGIQGKVVVGFIVEKDGSITDVHIVRSIDPSLDKEAIRIVKSMPKWNPALLKGDPVRQKMTMPVMFRIQ